jgi:3-hydroxyisobutyrate dehydrogenase-like beta-hydroxyacid dehydrogenase
MQVGFIGLGKMGTAMAVNLVAAGHALTVYNRMPAKTKGARLAKTLADTAQGEIVIYHAR